MKNIQRMGMAALIVGLSACATTPTKLDLIPLQWKPTSEMQLPPGTPSDLSHTKIQVDAFQDVRKQPELIAENRENPTARPVTTRDNVGDFVSKNLREVFNHMGLTTVDKDGDVVVSGEVRQFFVGETKTYKGRVLLHITLKNRAGKALWNGTATGEASRFGRSYSAENYYEVLSDCLINTASTLLEDPDFQAALQRKE